MDQRVPRSGSATGEADMARERAIVPSVFHDDRRDVTRRRMKTLITACNELALHSTRDRHAEVGGRKLGDREGYWPWRYVAVHECGAFVPCRHGVTGSQTV